MIELDEVVAALKRSVAPTLIVEGKDDYVAFEEFEIENVGWGFTVLPVQGRDNVEKLIRLAADINHPALAFLIDRDCSAFGALPPDLIRNDTFTTDGYAIENDLVRDGDATRLLKPSERIKFNEELASLARFFACAAACHLSGREGYALSCHPHRILGDNQALLPEIAAWVEQEERQLPDKFLEIVADPVRLIKGKSVVALLTRHLSGRRGRSVFSAANILEIGSRARGQYLRKIENDVKRFFQDIGVVS